MADVDAEVLPYRGQSPGEARPVAAAGPTRCQVGDDGAQLSGPTVPAGTQHNPDGERGEACGYCVTAV